MFILLFNLFVILDSAKICANFVKPIFMSYNLSSFNNKNSVVKSYLREFCVFLHSFKITTNS